MNITDILDRSRKIGSLHRDPCTFEADPNVGSILVKDEVRSSEEIYKILTESISNGEEIWVASMDGAVGCACLRQLPFRDDLKDLIEKFLKERNNWYEFLAVKK